MCLAILLTIIVYPFQLWSKDRFCRSLFILCTFTFVIVLSVHRFTDSNYHFGFLWKLFLCQNQTLDCNMDTRYWIVIWMHKLYASRYELNIHSKEHKRIKQKKLFFLRVLERNILIKKRNSKV